MKNPVVGARNQCKICRITNNNAGELRWTLPKKLKIKNLSPMCSRLLCDVYVDIMLVEFKANKGLMILVVIQSWVSASQKKVLSHYLKAILVEN